MNLKLHQQQLQQNQQQQAICQGQEAPKAKKEATSSDNSPTLSRKAPLVKVERANSKAATQDSGDESGESSASGYAKANLVPAKVEEATESKTRRPTNQPSEALAHFMFEFSKTVLSKAGGTVSTSVFLNHQAHPPGHPHRNLHICSFLISLYALGLQNCVQPTWLSRTYSSHVTWVNSHAVDLGFSAICILIECWQGRLTPSECVALADRVSRGRDNMAVKAAAELALSSLRFAQMMSLTEIQRALIQSKEQSNEMLQRACVTVEHAVKDANNSNLVEILFTVAKRWNDLFVESMQQQQPTLASVPAPLAASNTNPGNEISI